MSQNIPPPALDTISEENIYSNKTSPQCNVSSTSVFSSYKLVKRCRSERDIPNPVMSKEEWMNAHQCKRTRSLENEYKKSMAEINAEFDEKTIIVKETYEFFSKYKSYDALQEYKGASGSSGSLENKFPTNSSSEGQPSSSNEANEAHSDSSSTDSKSGSFVSTGEAAFTKAIANTDLKMEKRPIIPEFTTPPSNIAPITFSDIATTSGEEKTNSSEGTTSAATISPQRESDESEEGFSVLQPTTTTTIVQDTTTIAEGKKRVANKKKNVAEQEVEEVKVSERKKTVQITTSTSQTAPSTSGPSKKENKLP